MTISEYVGKLKTLNDEMAAAVKPLDDEDMISYILAGLDLDFNPVVSDLVARTYPVMVTEVYS